jgi:hypothetical protein
VDVKHGDGRGIPVAQRRGRFFIEERAERSFMGRTKQRENRRAKAMEEEELDLCNDFGDEDLTPYLAVKNIIRRWKMEETCGEFMMMGGDAG